MFSNCNISNNDYICSDPTIFFYNNFINFITFLLIITSLTFYSFIYIYILMIIICYKYIWTSNYIFSNLNQIFSCNS